MRPAPFTSAPLKASDTGGVITALTLGTASMAWSAEAAAA